MSWEYHTNFVFYDFVFVNTKSQMDVKNVDIGGLMQERHTRVTSFLY